MAYSWKAKDCVENAASDELRRGADPLFEDEDGTSALQLAMKLLIKHFNKCLASSAPLEGSILLMDRQQFTQPSDRNSGGPPVLRGLSDHNVVVSVNVSESDDNYVTILNQTASFFYNARYDELVLANHSKLLRTAKGLFAVVKLMCENVKLNKAAHDVLCENIAKLASPVLYVAVMNVLFAKNKSEYDFSDIWESKRAYSFAVKCRTSGIYILKFITQVSNIFQQLLALFHFDLYSSAFNENFSSKGPRKQLILDRMNVNVVELFAHLAFVVDLPLLFDAMILQPKFSLGRHAKFDWDSVLSNTLRNRDKFGIYVEPLLRKSLGDKVEREFDSENRNPIYCLV